MMATATVLTTAAEGFPAATTSLDPDPLARRRLIRFAGLGIAAFALAIVARMPAGVVIPNAPWRSGVAGTIWNGEVGVAGGSRLEWHWAPLRSLTSLGFAVDWHATGPDTDLGGQAMLRPGGVALDAVSGSADGTLLEALQPDLPFACDFAMQVELPRLRTAVGDAMADGRVAIDPGTCVTRPGGAATATPAMLLEAQATGRETRIRLVPQAQRRQSLIDASLRENGMLGFTLTPDGARVLPFTGAVPGVRVETRF